MGRWKNKRKARRAGIIFLFTCALLCVTLFLQWAFNKSEKLILPLAQQVFCDRVTDIVYSAASDINFDKAVTPHYTSENKISYIQTDSIVINKCVGTILDTLEKRLGNEDIKIAIPVGDIVGDALSLGQGPDILVELNRYKSTRAEVKSSFESAGINQTLHRLTLELEVEAVVLLPGLKAEKVYASLKLPIAETVIVGESPKTYFN